MSPTDDGDPVTFADLGLDPELLAALTHLGYEEPTPIQRESIPPLVAGQDLLGQAATGTGKTAAFALPILQRLVGRDRTGEPLALVLVPTRELAMQVSEAIHKYGKGIGARVLPIFGGQPIGRQLQALRRGIDVVVATPGRAIDHIGRGSLPLGGVDMVVLDEADEMLDMGFAEDIDAILAATPSSRQTILFSATLPARINRLAQRHLTDPVRIEIATPSTAPGEAPQVRQVAYVVPRAHKAAALGRVLDVETPTAAIVFCRTRNEVDDLTETLNGRGYRAEALHGGINQEQRDRVMGRLRGGTADLLIATDVAARGLDIDHLTHVVNYDVPSAPESYVHRIGRVWRAGREGVAITLAEPREHRMLKNIERLTKQKIAIEKVPTVADLRTRRMEVTLATLRESILNDELDDDDGGLDHYRVVVESLTSEFDLMEVALAAVKLAHDASAATGAGDEVDIPDVTLRPSSPQDRGGRDRPPRGDGPRRTFDDNKRGAPGKPPSGDMTRLFVGIGHDSKVRPGDLVGAIAGETSLSGRDIGAIQIRDHFSLVEVPESAVEEVIGAIRNTTIKGQKAQIRRERDDPRAR